MKHLKQTDLEIFNLIQLEKKRQSNTLMMIPSENTVSQAVEEAVGSCLGNKYAEGYPGRRYYQGQLYVDQIENLAIERAKKIFGVPYVNVQPHSGSPANFAVYTALLKPGDTLMGLSLASGGHLTHGANLNASSIYFNSISYSVNEEGYLDYDAILKLALEQKPKLIVCGTTAYPRIIDWKKFAEIAQEVGAYLLADISHISGLVIAGIYPSPVPYVDIITTTTHKTLRGPRGAMIMATEQGLKKDEKLGEKINKAIIPGIQGGPHINAIAGIAVALRETESQNFASYSKQIIINAKILEQEFKKYDFKIATNGTDTHLLLIDLRNKDLLGNTVAEGCEVANIIFNRNSIPFDPNPPFYPSGIRLGTPGLTSRGMKENEMIIIARAIHNVVEALRCQKTKMGLSSIDERKRKIRNNLVNSTKELRTIKNKIQNLCKEFPIPSVFI